MSHLLLYPVRLADQVDMKANYDLLSFLLLTFQTAAWVHLAGVPEPV
jgi:hypothetical protein